MNYILSILIIFAFAINVYSQDALINQVDTEKLKQGRWIIKNSAKTTIISEGNYFDNKKDGIWKSFFPDGKIENEITYVRGRPNGFAKFYYNNGNVKEQGNWKGTKWIGEYKFFHENGNPYYAFNHDAKGRRTGEQIYYHENGQEMIKGNWIGGKEDGVIKTWTKEGKLKSEKVFNGGKMDTLLSKTYIIKPKGGNDIEVKNKPDKDSTIIIKKTNTVVSVFDGNGHHVTFNRHKQKVSEGEWKNGKLIDGKQYQYREGVLFKTSVLKGGVLDDVVFH